MSGSYGINGNFYLRGIDLLVNVLWRNLWIRLREASFFDNGPSESTCSILYLFRGPPSPSIMPPITSIPRFLLPVRSPLWSLSPKTTIRNASSKPKNSASNTPSKPLVLEKPSKFNPPSHPARLRKDPPRYPGPQLSAEEKARQRVRKYPNMMPQKGTFMHWFLNDKSIHVWITLVFLYISLPPNLKSNSQSRAH